MKEVWYTASALQHGLYQFNFMACGESEAKIRGDSLVQKLLLNINQVRDLLKIIIVNSLSNSTSN